MKINQLGNFIMLTMVFLSSVTSKAMSLKDLPQDKFVVEGQEGNCVALCDQQLTDLQGISLAEPLVDRLDFILKLKNNHIKEIPNEIKHLTNLMGLKLYEPDLERIDALTACSNLAELNIVSDKLQTLPSEPGYLTNLVQLVSASPQQKDIPESYSALNQLVVFGAMGLENFPHAIRATSLASLFLRNCQFKALPEELKNCSALKCLNISNNKLENITLIPEFTKLENLWLNNNTIKVVPETFGSLTNLANLTLVSNYITDIPQSFVHCNQLQYLDLQNNKLTKIPDVILQLTNLHHLNLANNEINTLPFELIHLTKLLKVKTKEDITIEMQHIINGLINGDASALSKLSEIVGASEEEINNMSNMERFSIITTMLQKMASSCLIANLPSLNLSNNPIGLNVFLKLLNSAKEAHKENDKETCKKYLQLWMFLRKLHDQGSLLIDYPLAELLPELRRVIATYIASMNSSIIVDA